MSDSPSASSHAAVIVEVRGGGDEGEGWGQVWRCLGLQRSRASGGGLGTPHASQALQGNRSHFAWSPHLRLHVCPNKYDPGLQRLILAQLGRGGDTNSMQQLGLHLMIYTPTCNWCAKKTRRQMSAEINFARVLQTPHHPLNSCICFFKLMLKRTSDINLWTCRDRCGDSGFWRERSG